MAEMKSVNCSYGAVPKISDVMQLIARLPYAAACDFAAAVDGDVEKIVSGAESWLTAEDEAEQAASVSS